MEAISLEDLTKLPCIGSKKALALRFDVSPWQITRWLKLEAVVIEGDIYTKYVKHIRSK